MATKHLRQSRVNPKPAASFWLHCCCCRHSNNVSGMVACRKCIDVHSSSVFSQTLEDPGRSWIPPTWLEDPSSPSTAHPNKLRQPVSHLIPHRQGAIDREDVHARPLCPRGSERPWLLACCVGTPRIRLFPRERRTVDVSVECCRLLCVDSCVPRGY